MVPEGVVREFLLKRCPGLLLSLHLLAFARDGGAGEADERRGRQRGEGAQRDDGLGRNPRPRLYGPAPPVGGATPRAAPTFIESGGTDAQPAVHLASRRAEAPRRG